ncbi:hypothetical protein [Corynebacterium hansenii]|nr:hypothetical protein [Corynebacterium hansenii]
MQQVKRLFAWADADDETRNMELHMQVAFGLLAEQGRTTQPKWQLSEDELEARERPLVRDVQLTQAYRWERAALATKIARSLHCSFAWIGSLTQDAPTVGLFVGCAPHVDRARLLFELIDPDLRLLTRFIGPPDGKGTGPNGAPSGDGMDFYRSRSSAMLDVAVWVGERLHETEALAAARGGLINDFAVDLQLAERYVDEMWGDTVNVLARTEGLPDLPMVDGLPAERFREFMEEIEELEELAGEGLDDDDDAEDDEFDDDADFDEDDEFDECDDPDGDAGGESYGGINFGILFGGNDEGEDEDDGDDEDEEGEDGEEGEDADEEEGAAPEEWEKEWDEAVIGDASQGLEDSEEPGEDDVDGVWRDAEDAGENLGDVPLFSLFDVEPPAESSIIDATWVYFVEDEEGNDVDPCLIRFGAAGWQLYYPAMDEWFGDPVLEEMALESGLFRSATREEAEDWVDLLADPFAEVEGVTRRSVSGEVEKCMEDGMDEETARHVVRLRWGNLPDALLSE